MSWQRKERKGQFMSGGAEGREGKKGRVGKRFHSQPWIAFIKDAMFSESIQDYDFALCFSSEWLNKNCLSVLNFRNENISIWRNQYSFIVAVSACGGSRGPHSNSIIVEIHCSIPLVQFKILFSDHAWNSLLPTWIRRLEIWEFLRLSASF